MIKNHTREDENVVSIILIWIVSITLIKNSLDDDQFMPQILLDRIGLVCLSTTSEPWEYEVAFVYILFEGSDESPTGICERFVRNTQTPRKIVSAPIVRVQFESFHRDAKCT